MSKTPEEANSRKVRLDSLPKEVQDLVSALSLARAFRQKDEEEELGMLFNYLATALFIGRQRARENKIREGGVFAVRFEYETNQKTLLSIVMPALLKAGLDVHGKYHGYTPLTRAAASGSLDLVKLLMAEGAVLNTVSTYGRVSGTPLLVALEWNELDVFEYLLNQPSVDLSIPLKTHRHEREVNLNVLELFSEKYPHIARNVNPTAAELKAMSPEERRLHEIYLKIRLREAKTKEEALFTAIQAGAFGTVEKLLKENPRIDLNFVSKQSEVANTLLLEALDKEQLEIAAFLLEQGADPWRRNSVALNALHMLMMVFRDMTKEKAHLTLSILDRLKQDKQFSAELNSLGGGRTPSLLSLNYQPFDLMKQMHERLQGGEFLSDRGPLWAEVLNSACLKDAWSYIKDLKCFRELTEKSLRERAELFSGKDALGAIIGMLDETPPIDSTVAREWALFCFSKFSDAHKKTAMEQLNKLIAQPRTPEVQRQFCTAILKELQNPERDRRPRP